MNYSKTYFNIILVVLVMVCTIPAFAQAESPSCDFSRDLEVGAVGEDVRCMQKYLNNQGFKIAETGIGSPGNETNMFGELTKEAVKKWQAANSINTTGNFGPLSRAKFLEKIAAALTSQISSMGGSVLGASTVSMSATPTIVTPTVSNEEKEARSSISEALDKLEEAQNAVDDTDDQNLAEDGQDTIDDAKKDLFKAFQAYVDKDFVEMKKRAEDAIDSLKEVISDISGNEDDAQEAIDDAQKTINDAEDEINSADDDGDDVHDANNLLDDAKDKLDDAENAFDDGEYDKAESLAKQAENLADDAVDAIGN